MRRINIFINTIRLFFVSSQTIKKELIDDEHRYREELLSPDFKPIGNTVGISCSPCGFGGCLCWDYKCGRFIWVDLTPMFSVYFYKRRIYL